MTKLAGSRHGSISQRHGSPDPNPYHTKMSPIRITGFKVQISAPPLVGLFVKITAMMNAWNEIKKSEEGKWN